MNYWPLSSALPLPFPSYPIHLQALTKSASLTVDQMSDRPDPDPNFGALGLADIWHIRNNSKKIRKFTIGKTKGHSPDNIRIQITGLITRNSDRITEMVRLACGEACLRRCIGVAVSAYSAELAWLYGRQLALLEEVLEHLTP